MENLNNILGKYTEEKAEDDISALPEDIKKALIHRKMHYIIEAPGTEKDAEAFINKYGQPSSELMHMLDKLSGIPVDIRPVFPDF